MRPELRLISSIRDAHPDMEALFMFGRCYSFFLILRSVFPEAEPWYSKTEGHVFTKIEGHFYDIRGLHLRAPKDIERLDHNRDHKPHRWSSGDGRRLTA